MSLHIFMDLSLQFRDIGLRLWLLPYMRVVDESRVKAVIAIVNKKSRFSLVMACFISYVWYIFLHQCSVHHVYNDGVWLQSPAAIDVR